MWVRSQDGEILVKVVNVFVKDNYISVMDETCRGNESYRLGEYSTKEKALKVLDKIVAQMELCIETRIHLIPYSMEPKWDTCEKVATVVFQMPQDDEVEI